MNYSHRKFRISIVLAQLLLGTSMCVDAATITINSNSGGVGGSNCTLRDAITAANTDTATGGCLAGSGADTINFTFGSTFPITLLSEDTPGSETGLPDIDTTITIDGDSSSSTIIQRDTSKEDFRIFTVNSSGKLTLNYVTVTGGDHRYGGGIQSSGDLTLNNSTVTGNYSGNNGAGIYANTTGKTVSIQNSTITNNLASEFGGGLYLRNGTIAIAESTIADNTAEFSGGGCLIRSADFVAITKSTISGNAATILAGGLHLFNNTATVISDTTISNNTASSSGGGILADSDNTLIKYSTINSNVSVSHRGGGIYSIAGTMTIKNSTISDNIAEIGGGGIFNKDGLLYIQNATINHNQSESGGGGVHNDNPIVDTLKIQNTIIANSLTSAGVQNDTFGTPPNLDNNNNLIMRDGGNWNVTCTNCIIGFDPLLRSLADNGGPTWTNALQHGSPAIDAGDQTTCINSNITKDQRYKTRDASCDIGAFEYKSFGSNLPALMYLLL